MYGRGPDDEGQRGDRAPLWDEAEEIALAGPCRAL